MIRLNIQRVLFIFLFGTIVHSKAEAQNNFLKSNRSLTEVLKILSKKENVFINFNPEVTNRIQIKDVSLDKNAIELLNSLLANHDLEIKKASRNFLYVIPIQKIIIKGCVKEKERNKKLSDINVLIDGKSSVRTDVNGCFSFSVPKGHHKLKIENKFYYPKLVNKSFVASTSVVIELKKKESKKKTVIIQIMCEKEEVYMPYVNKTLADSSLKHRLILPDTLAFINSKDLIPKHPLATNSSNYALKSNLIMWGLASPNLTIEKKIDQNVTVELSLGGEFGNSKHNDKSISYLIQPEVRYWLFRSFKGAFIGFHMYYAQFSKSNIVYPFQRRGTSNYDREGYLYGMGASCGYRCLIDKHWHIEATVGAGNIHLAYDKITWNNSLNNKKCLGYNYFGLTKAAINLVYGF